MKSDFSFLGGLMYLIKSGEKVIYDSRDKNTYPVIKPSYNEGLNEAGTLTFTLLPGHPYYNDMKKMQTFITAYRDDTEFFYGRVLITDKELDGRIEVTCEGGLTFLLDSEMEKANYHESIEAFFRRCIAAHNAQVEVAKQFSVGTINAEKALETGKQYDFNITSYTDVKSTIETMITGRFGGYVRIRPDGNGGHCIDYLEDYGRTNTQLVRIGHNVIDKSDHISGENIFTILRPVGRSQPTGQSGENTDVTIESMSQSDITLENVVKDGKLLKLTDKISLYGNITRTEQFNSAETPIDLLKKAEDYIRRRGTQLPAVCEVNYIDFYHLNSEIMDVRLGDIFTMIEDFNDQVMTVGEISLDLENPGNDTFRLKNPEEINANRLDYNVESGGKGGGSSNSLSSSTAKKNGQDDFRYKYYHEQDEFAKIATKQVEIAAEEHFSAISNKMYLTVMEKEGEPGEFVLQALSGTDDPNGATLIMNVDGFTFRKKAGYDTDGETILANYASTAELNIEKDRITAEVTRATTAEGAMSSRITQTADAITAEVARATTAEGSMSSRITQTADAITAEVTRASEAEGRLSSRITINANGIETKVSKDGVISAINQTAESVTISASKINLSGYVTATAFSSEQARVNNFFNGTTSATSISSNSISAGSVYADTFYIGRSESSRVVQKNLKMGTLTFSNSFVTGTGTAGDMDLGHYHAISTSVSGGTVTITQGAAQSTAGTATFNIADTQYYKDGVASAKNDRSVKSSSFLLTNVTEYPSANMIAFNIEAIANDGTIYTSNLQSVTYTGESYTAKSYTRYGALAYYDDSQDKYVSAGYGYWFLSNSKTLYEKS